MDDKQDLPSLAELAAEANRNRFRRRKSDRSIMGNAPWWIQVAAKYGFAGLVAAVLLSFMLKIEDRKLDITVENSAKTLAAQQQANVSMTAYATESLRRSEIDTLILRQMCANDAKSQAALDRCYVTLPPNGK